MSPIIKNILRLAVPLAALLLPACGGGISSQRDPGEALARYTVSGAVSGLTGTLVLQNNSGDNITVTADGNFTFTGMFSSGSTYAVSVLTQPVGQTCSVSTGVGTVSGNNVSNVAVTCSAYAYTVGGTVSGLSGTVVLQNNSGDNLTISTNGYFTFASAISDGGAYTVTVLTQPTGQTCTVSAGAGTVSGGNVTGIALVCAINTFEVVVDAGATGGGTWSGTNPDVFTSNASVATVSVTDIQSRLNAGIPVTIITSPAALGNGDISVSSAVSWSANTLTLKARRNITFNAALNGSGTAGLALQYGQGAVAAGNTGTYKVSAPVNLASTGSFSTKLGSDGAVNSYTILTSLGAAGSVTTTDLQGMNGGLGGNYVLGANIDASATNTWNAGAGFTPVGGNANLPAAVPNFTGSFDGLGHTITGLTINNAGTDFQGLFGKSSGTLRNVGLLNSSVSGRSAVGTLAGFSSVAISYCYADGGSVTGNWSGAGIGGLKGGGGGSISNSYANVTLSNGGFGGIANSAGGLAGNAGAVSNSYATGSVYGNTDSIGGLLGQANGAITNSYATGAVTAAGGATNVGGLVGKANGGGSASNSYWDKQATGQNGSALGTGVNTTTEMKTQATFSGWDFVGMWKIVEGVSYPTLR